MNYRPNTAYPIGQDIGWVPGLPEFGKVLYTHTHIPNDFKSEAYLSSNNKFVDGAYRSGGSFFIAKATYDAAPSASATLFVENYGVHYKGSFYCQVSSGNFPPYGWSDARRNLGDLDSRGAEAWDRMRPDEPIFDGLRELAELKDLVPSLKDSTSNIMSKIGSEWRKINGMKGPTRSLHKHGGPQSGLSLYPKKTAEWHLAIQFGWLPILSSILDFVDAQRKGQEHLRNLIDKAEKPVRRKTNLSDSKDVGLGYTYTYEQPNGYGASYLQPQFVTYVYRGRSSVVQTIATTSKTWAMGKFRYYLPPGPHDVAWTRKMRRRLMGNRLTPSTIWNLLPWSFLVDYFVDVGHFLNATQNGVSDCLVADYAYIMRTAEHITNNDTTGGYCTSMKGAVSQISAGSQRKYTMKCRLVADPFGFGMSEGSLNPRQKAILSALVLSRS